MNTFFKTFVICLVITLGFLFYKFFGKDGYSKNIDNVNSSMYTIQKEERSDFVEKQQKDAQKPVKKEDEKKLHTCYFYNNQGKLTPIVREVKGSNSLESAILLLLKGPLVSESKKGIYSEIPPNVDLINITSDNQKAIINLTSNFGNGGGFSSVENRVKQLSATAKNAAPNKAIYLYIDGKEVEYLGGDGVYIKQPLE